MSQRFEGIVPPQEGEGESSPEYGGPEYFRKLEEERCEEENAFIGAEKRWHVLDPGPLVNSGDPATEPDGVKFTIARFKTVAPFPTAHEWWITSIGDVMPPEGKWKYRIVYEVKNGKWEVRTEVPEESSKD